LSAGLILLLNSATDHQSERFGISAPGLIVSGWVAGGPGPGTNDVSIGSGETGGLGWEGAWTSVTLVGCDSPPSTALFKLLSEATVGSGCELGTEAMVMLQHRDGSSSTGRAAGKLAVFGGGEGD